MLRKFKISVVLLFSLSLFSCEDYLTLLPPQGLVTEEYWKNKEDVEAVLMTSYKQFTLLDQSLFEYGELRADMIKAENNLPEHKYNITISNIYPDNSLSNWQGFYKVIHHCNLILKNAAGVQAHDPTFIDYDLNRFQAEALFLRSLAYFYLVRIFNDVPLVLNPSEDDDSEFFLPKTESEVILDTITSNLIRASRNIPKNIEYGSPAENKGRATNGAIMALLADISLWRFDYDNCILYANEVELSGNYDLVPESQWYNNYYPGNTLESIFELQFNSELEQNNRLFFATYLANYYTASNYAMEILAPTVSRDKEGIRGNGTLREFDGLIWKYIGSAADGRSFRSAAQRNSANWIIYRYADVLLMKAEALSQLERFDEALRIINEIRRRANVASIDNVSFTTEAFEDVILEERAKELAFEGKRWFDLMRMGRRNDYARKNELIQILIRNANAAQKRILATKLNNPLGWYMPIYEDELERNNNLVQNEYYEEYYGD
ncbi:MAG: RagB/SusD family nutrient uptake outer membrane protein [bacterium]